MPEPCHGNSMHGSPICSLYPDPAGAASLSSMSMLHAFGQSRVSLDDPLRGPAFTHRHGTFSLGDIRPGGSLCPAGTAMTRRAKAEQEPMPPGRTSTPACRPASLRSWSHRGRALVRPVCRGRSSGRNWRHTGSLPLHRFQKREVADFVFRSVMPDQTQGHPIF